MTLAQVQGGHLSLAQALSLLTAKPAAWLGLDTGKIAKGRVADLCLFHPDRSWRVVAGQLPGKAQNTPFDGRCVGRRGTRHLESRPPGVRMIFVALLLLGYFCGSVPFGLLLTRTAGLGDIRGIGSGNIGATNVLRTGSKGAGRRHLLLLDGVKGAIPVLVAAAPFGQTVMLATGLAALLGHLFPVWLRFKGGKGVATGLGVLLGAFFPVGLAACATWLLMARASRPVLALSPHGLFPLAPLAALAFERWHLAILAAVIAVFVFWTHRDNIARLRTGTEPHIGRKA